jgi:hypothetical protein
MTTATVNKLTEVTSIERPARRGRKAQEKNGVLAPGSSWARQGPIPSR